MYPPTNLRIVITAGYIVESRLGIVVIPPVADGVFLRQGPRSAEHVPPGVIDVGGQHRPVRAQYLLHVPLQVPDQDALRLRRAAGPGVAYQLPARVVMEDERVPCAHVRQQAVPVPDIAVGLRITQ